MESMNFLLNENYSNKVKLERYLSYYNIPSADDLTKEQINSIMISFSNGIVYEEESKDTVLSLSSYFPASIYAYINKGMDISVHEINTLTHIKWLLKFPFEFPNDKMRNNAIEYCVNILALSKNSYITKELSKLEKSSRFKLFHERVYPNNCIMNCDENCPCNIE